MTQQGVKSNKRLLFGRAVILSVNSHLHSVRIAPLEVVNSRIRGYGASIVKVHAIKHCYSYGI